MATITTQAELIRNFKQDNPGLDYRPIKSTDGRGAMYKADTRAAFIDYVDSLHRSGVISDKLANRATFEPKIKTLYV